MIRIQFIIAGFCLCSASLLAQQTPMYTQYMLNPLVINPAVAGTNNYYQIRLNNRFQWAGFTDAPITNGLSVYGPHASKKLDMGYGGYVLSDITGPTSTLNVSGCYAYNIAINDEIRMSMGLSLGMLQRKTEGTQIKMRDLLDNTLGDQTYAAYVPDGNVGIYVYSSSFNFGFSAMQLFNNKIKLEEKNSLNRLKTHFFLTGSYKYFINREFAIEPSLIIKAVSPVPLQVDISARAIYKNMLWAGFSFRTGDAVSILLGYNHDNKFSFGYSYDIGITAIRKYNYGSHELMVSYRFNTLK